MTQNKFNLSNKNATFITIIKHTAFCNKKGKDGCKVFFLNDNSNLRYKLNVKEIKLHSKMPQTKYFQGYHNEQFDPQSPSPSIYCKNP